METCTAPSGRSRGRGHLASIGPLVAVMSVAVVVFMLAGLLTLG